MKTTYWERESIATGKVVALFKIEEKYGERTGYIYKNGTFKEYDPILAKAGYDDDYDCITEAEAKEIMKKL